MQILHELLEKIKVLASNEDLFNISELYQKYNQMVMKERMSEFGRKRKLGDIDLDMHSNQITSGVNSKSLCQKRVKVSDDDDIVSH